ncbi:MAG: transcription termination factor Rho, partial [Thermodesulfobacteriota bacterium]|nr:transcription termination factor Rho [Thermodesulfobacteriota bacterium]
MDVAELKEKKVSELMSIAHSLSVEGAGSMRKQELIFAILQA